MGDGAGRRPRERAVGAWLEDPSLPGRRRGSGGADRSAARTRADGKDRAGAAEERVARTIVAVTSSRSGCSGRRRNRACGERRGSRCGASPRGVGPLTPGRRADRARRASRRAPHLTERAYRPDAPVRRRASPAGRAEGDRSPPRRVDHRCGAGGGDRRPAGVTAFARGGSAATRAARAGAGHPARYIGPIEAREPAQLHVRGPPGWRARRAGAAAQHRCGYQSAEILGRGPGHLGDD